MRKGLLTVASPALASLVVAPASSASSVPGAANCQMLPSNSVWHADVSHLPVYAKSATYVASIGTTAHVHADFGRGIASRTFS